MKFGMNMLLWAPDVADEKYYPTLEYIKNTGFDSVEVPLINLENPSRFKDLKTHLDNLGLERTCVTIRTAETNPVSPDAAIRKAGIENMKEILDICASLDIHKVVGPIYAALGEFTGTGPTEDELNWCAEVLREYGDLAKERDITFALEFLNRFEIYLINCSRDAQSLVDRTDHPNVKLMYDTFHANIEEKNIGEAVASCKKDLIHIHISENDRSTPGQGLVDWDSTFKAFKDAGYEGNMTVEAFGLAMPDFAAATKIWRPMFDTEEQLAKDALAFMKEMCQKHGLTETAATVA